MLGLGRRCACAVCAGAGQPPEGGGLSFPEGTVEYCRANDVRIQAWGSLAQGIYSGARRAEAYELVNSALLGVMPWNFSCYQVARLAAPNLVLGNTILLKHASICPRSARAIEQILHDAGVPEDVYVNTFASSRQVLSILADPRIQGVSLTGQ